jgi:hypothetical protein
MSRVPVIAATALLVSCNQPPPEPAHVLVPLGTREPLHAGYWQGPMGGTLIDFHVDQVTPTEVHIHVSGNVINPPPKASQPPGYQPYFYDRPKICTRRPDGRTFDCPHYADLHIDNGLLCGSYVLESQVFHPCLQPAGAGS